MLYFPLYWILLARLVSKAWNTTIHIFIYNVLSSYSANLGFSLMSNFAMFSPIYSLYSSKSCPKIQSEIGWIHRASNGTVIRGNEVDIESIHLLGIQPGFLGSCVLMLCAYLWSSKKKNMYVYPSQCVHAVRSSLSADDRVDFSFERMKGLSYDGVHIQVPCLDRKWSSLDSLSLLASLPEVRQNTGLHTPSPLASISFVH